MNTTLMGILYIFFLFFCCLVSWDHDSFHFGTNIPIISYVNSCSLIVIDLVPSLFVKLESTRNQPNCWSANFHFNVWFVKLPKISKPICVFNHRQFWPCKSPPRLIWLVCSKIPTFVPSTPNVWPSCPRTFNWPVASVVNEHKSTSTSSVHWWQEWKNEAVLLIQNDGSCLCQKGCGKRLQECRTTNNWKKKVQACRCKKQRVGDWMNITGRNIRKNSAGRAKGNDVYNIITKGHNSIIGLLLPRSNWQ